MLKLNPNKMKAYAGGTGSILSLVTTGAVSDNLVVIITWLMSFLGELPPEVAQALAFIINLAIAYAVGYLITYWSPPNQVTAGDYVTQVKKATETQELK